MFHWRNNIYFGRKADGSVRILAFSVQPAEWPQADDPPSVLANTYFDVSVDADSWESIIASVSAGGELFNRFYAARDFHESTGEIRITQTPTQHAPNGHAEAR